MELVNAFKLQAAELFWSLPRCTTSDKKIKTIIESLEKNGIWCEEGFLEPEYVDELVGRAKRIYENHRGLLTIESNGADERFYGIDRLFPEFKLEGKMDLPDQIHANFGMGLHKSWFQLLGKINDQTNNLGSGSGWHRDSPFTHQFKALIYLTDVTDENGPFEYIEGSHRKECLREFAGFLGLSTSCYRFSSDQIANGQKAGVLPQGSVVLGRKGSMVLADTRGLHWGRPLRKGWRMALTRYYFDQRVPKYYEKLSPLLRSNSPSA